MITNTVDLTRNEYQYYIHKMLDLHIIERVKSDKFKISPLFERGLASQKGCGLDKAVKKELGDKDVESGGVYLSGLVLSGLVLLVFGIRGNELFHSLNIILQTLNLSLIPNWNEKAVLEWINVLSIDMKGVMKV